MGCKLICGEKAPGRANIPTPVSHRGSVQRFFYVFIFCLTGNNWEYSGGGRGGGYRFCVHLSPPLMLSQCFFSLSFELVLQHLTLRAGPSHVGGSAERRQAVQPAPACSGAPASHTYCLVCLFIDSCCPAIGASVFGVRGAAYRLCPTFDPSPQKCQPAPPTQPDQRHTALRTPGPSRDHASRAASSYSSCIKLSPCPFLPLPQCFF